MSWFKDLFFEKEESSEVKLEEKKEEIKSYDYNLKIFEIIRKEDISQVTNYIVHDKTLALIKMHKFIGSREDLKEVLNTLKQTCDVCDSKVIGLTNNLYFATKNSVNIEKEAQ